MPEIDNGKKNPDLLREKGFELANENGPNSLNVRAFDYFAECSTLVTVYLFLFCYIVFIGYFFFTHLFIPSSLVLIIYLLF